MTVSAYGRPVENTAKRYAQFNADASLNTISELLGHKDTRMTRRHYAHLLWDKLKETVDERLPKFE
jgi:integrase